MHQIDNNLYEAWHRVVEQCRRDPVETLRRALRQMGKGLNQPMRDWCLCLRASDRRIDSGDHIFEALPDEELCIEDDMNELASPRLRKPHLVTLEGQDIRRLTAPIYVHLPGVPQKELARMAGVKRGFTGRWIKAGTALVVDRGPRGEKIVWTPGGLDPNNFNGRPPDPMWGTMWRAMHEEFPLDYQQRFMRVPWFIHRRGRRAFNGFEWICPGRYVRVKAGTRVGPVELPSSRGRGGRAEKAAKSEIDWNDPEQFDRWAAANGGMLQPNGSWEFAADPVGDGDAGGGPAADAGGGDANGGHTADAGDGDASGAGGGHAIEPVPPEPTSDYSYNQIDSETPADADADAEGTLAQPAAEANERFEPAQPCSLFNRKLNNGEADAAAAEAAIDAGCESGSARVREGPKRERQIEHERCARFLSLTLPPQMRRPGECEEVEYVHVPCGRRCHFLYAPMPVWTLARALGFDEGLPLPEGCSLGGLGAVWKPGSTASTGAGWRSFACKHCWNVRCFSLTTYRGWNDFVTLVSGGLLLGRDVPRPDDEAPLKYRRKMWEQRKRYRETLPG